jgi:hypothetical protein
MLDTRKSDPPLFPELALPNSVLPFPLPLTSSQKPQQHTLKNTR